MENAVKIGGGSFSVNAGETLTVPIPVSNAVNMNVVDLDITYNQKALELVGYSVGEILKIGKIDVSENQSQISFTCQNLSVARDGNFLYLKFKVAEYIEKNEEILISCKRIPFADGSSGQAVCCNPSITIKNPYAGKPAFVCSDSGVFIIDNYIDISVYINNNHGMMGFGIDVSYDSAILKPVSVTKGEVLGSGNFEDNIGNISDKLKIRWNNSANISENGLLFTLRFNILNVENLNTIPIAFTYSQPDTYNEKWEDVELDIKIGTIIVKREHTIRFVIDGKAVSTQKFITGMTASEIELPEVPPKSGYNGSWEAFSLGDKDIDVNCIYTPIVYSATFVDADGKVIGTDEFTLSDAALDYPQTDELEGYAWSWDKHEIIAENITVTGKYVPIEYTATFMADGNVVSTQKFTVETESLDEPPVPQKAGCYAYWGAYEIAAHDITIEAQYKSPEAFMIAKRTLYAGETYRLLPSCNFSITEKSWRTNDASVATVDQNGIVTAVGEGECVITVTCYGVDSLGNAVHASKSTQIVVKDNGKNSSQKTFRELFDEFFEVTLHDIVDNFKEFILLLLRYAY